MYKLNSSAPPHCPLPSGVVGPKSQKYGFLGRSGASETEIAEKRRRLKKKGPSTWGLSLLYSARPIAQHDAALPARAGKEASRGGASFHVPLPCLPAVRHKCRSPRREVLMIKSEASCTCRSVGPQYLVRMVSPSPKTACSEKLLLLHRCLQDATSPKPVTQSLPLLAVQA